MKCDRRTARKWRARLACSEAENPHVHAIARDLRDLADWTDGDPVEERHAATIRMYYTSSDRASYRRAMHDAFREAQELQRALDRTSDDAARLVRRQHLLWKVEPYLEALSLGRRAFSELRGRPDSLRVVLATALRKRGSITVAEAWEYAIQLVVPPPSRTTVGARLSDLVRERVAYRVGHGTYRCTYPASH